ncbi:hypothetical protein DFR58_101146 [Anaerobacterium chartisolvens]|uniref:Uncharacterized protein n=1 Tax=Anaerobacterium chartisolvens TaxID=1297424 RepID=A0A369BMN3_9FIRM|nr:hypothetical protein [Anaerobacterium chartisolvens]RCX20944.1 hypothetical protein DFR58_101146 [Anaerobacterium chartisolvens]
MNIFIAGPRAISKLNESVIRKIKEIIEDNFNILVGDANGVDKAVQHFCNEHNYRNVKVYATKGKTRNNIGNWYVHNVDVPKNLKGFDFYAAKDYEMARDADYGLMIWNGISKGTLNNIINLLDMGKKTILYYSPEEQFYVIKTLNGLKEFIGRCSKETQELFIDLLYKDSQLKLSVH